MERPNLRPLALAPAWAAAGENTADRAGRAAGLRSGVATDVLVPERGPLVDAATLQRDLGAPNLRIVDCRFDLGDVAAGRRAWAEATLATATYAHLDEHLSGPIVPGQSGRHPLPDPDALVAHLAAIGVGAGTRVVAFDDSGGCFAARLWWLLRWLGHDEVQVLDGGWTAWVRDERPTEPGRASGPAADPLVPNVRPEMQIDGPTLHQLREALVLVDARAPERYRGDVEPLDAHAGHIPGASNRPWRENLDASGHMRSPAQIRERLGGPFATHAPQEVVHYCGSGVTACHNLLALAHAGLWGARLYPGSWSDWITDPARPREAGPEPQAG